MTSSTNTELRAAMRELLLSDKQLQGEMVQHWMTAERQRKLELHAIELDDYHFNKWGYAVIGALVGLLCASEPGGLSEVQGFGLGFLLVYGALSWLEFSVQRRMKKAASE